MAFAALAVPCTTLAALGAGAASVEGDRARMQGSLRTTQLPTHALHEIETATGTVVRELSGPDGSVFAVSWEGPFLPDLRQLLGSSYDAFAGAARAKRRGRGPLVIRLPDLVVESAGHPRGFHGRAYLPQRLPQGVTAATVR